MHYEILAWAVLGALFMAMLGLALLGHRYGRHRVLTVGDAASHGTGVIDGALFALLGLLIAFTFATAYSRFDTRRNLVVQEANAISTAYLRLDLLPPEAQVLLRDKFREYVDSRLAFWQKLRDTPAAREELARATKLQDELWSQAVLASEQNQSARMLLLPALNEMIDITTTRLNAIQAHPPPLVFAMLAMLAMLCAWLIGYAMGKAEALNWLHVIGYAAIITLTIYVILDIEYPRFGLIRLDVAQELIAEVRKNMPLGPERN